MNAFWLQLPITIEIAYSKLSFFLFASAFYQYFFLALHKFIRTFFLKPTHFSVRMLKIKQLLCFQSVFHSIKMNTKFPLYSKLHPTLA